MNIYDYMLLQNDRFCFSMVQPIIEEKPVYRPMRGERLPQSAERLRCLPQLPMFVL